MEAECSSETPVFSALWRHILKEGSVTRIQYRQRSASKLSQEASAVAKYCNSKRTPFTFICKSAGCFRRNQDVTPTPIPVISVYTQTLL